MAIKARKTLVQVRNEDGYIYQREAVLFYDDVTKKEVDPTNCGLTEKEVAEMTNKAFDS